VAQEGGETMINETASIVIHRPVERVFAFMSQPKNRLRYDPKLLDVRQTPEGPLRLGTQIVEVRSMMGRRGEMVTEVSELEPNQKIGYRTLQKDPMSAIGAYQFQSVAEGTRLTLNFALNPRGILKFITPFLAGGLKRDIAAGLENIKTVLESQ
jgi:uncharacterized protein YndB with AHSA1/START domain